MYLILQALCAAYLVGMCFMLRTASPSQLIFLKLTPAAVGILLSFFTLADFMGWPV